jgi:hypothetical protein
MIKQSQITRKEAGVTKYYQDKQVKRVLALVPENLWRVGKEISMNNRETFTAYLIRALTNQINHDLKVTSKR